MRFDDLTKDDLIILLADRLLWASSVTGTIQFGTDDELLCDLADRADAGNDEFTDLINLVSKLTGRDTQEDPRDVKRREWNRQSNEKIAAIKAKAEAEAEQAFQAAMSAARGESAR